MKRGDRIIGGAFFLAAAAALVASGPDRAGDRPDRNAALASLVEAERSFARTSEEKGIREAFLAWLAPDAVVFRPAPVEGRPVYEKMDPANPAVLTWGPEIADISASGELGYTSGPYELRPGRGAEPTGFGHYISIWKKQPDGAWRVIVDAGIGHGPGGPLSTAVTDLGPPGAGEAPELSPEALRDSEALFVKTVAGAFEERAGREGLRAAYKTYAAEGVRAYRPGGPPLLGKTALLETVPARAGRVSPRSNRRRSTIRVGLAWSGDLAYQYGTFAFWKDRSAVETTAYLRIWRRPPGGDWAIVCDLELPVPPTGGRVP
jgi:ketosteroid isomerase-like protein